MQPGEQAPQLKHKKHSGLLWGVLALILALVAVGALWWWQQKVVNVATADCTTKDVALSVGQKTTATGITYIHAVVANTSKHACKVNGYPTTALLDAKGQAIPKGIAMNNDNYQAAAIILQPGDKAHAILGLPDIANFDESLCSAESTTLSLFLPGVIIPTTVGLTVPYAQKACPGYSVTVFLPGA